MNKKIILFIILTVALLLTSCGGKDKADDNKEGLPGVDDDLTVVGVSQIGSESMWRTANTNSVQEAFSTENGYYLIFNNARQKQENQFKAIRSFISQKVDYIVFSPITEDGWDTVLMEAKEAGIPVILMDRKVNVSDESLYTSWVGSDFYKEGTLAGEYLEKELDKKGLSDKQLNIVVLKGTEGATSAIGRTEGFEKIAKKHGNWQIVAEVDAEYTTAKAKEEMKKILNEHKDIDVIISQNDDMTFGAIEVLNDAGYTTGVEGQVILVSFDAVRKALEMVREGIINIDVECNPCLGENVESLVKDLIAGKEVEKNNYIEENVFTIENVNDYINTRAY